MYVWLSYLQHQVVNHQLSFTENFLLFNKENLLASQRKRTLLAVSGGVDSVAMCELFYLSKFPFEIAHCNFGLRGDESNADEEFVKSLAAKYKVEFHVKHFETEQYSIDKRVSTQMAARDLRYAWFEELSVSRNLKLIATAHHLNDSIETVLYNIAKGTGIRGLGGIPVRNGNIIRPLLFATRQQIESFSKEHNLNVREDSSNASDKYIRNKIRHHVVPLFKEINPAFENTMRSNIEHFKEAAQLYNRQITKESKQIFLQRNADVYIPVLKLRKIKNAASVLFEYLKEYDFSASQVEDILSCLDAEPGKQFLTDKARVIKDRRFFILTPLSETAGVHFATPNTEVVISSTQRLDFKLMENDSLKIGTDNHLAYLDTSQIKFPLTVRRWKAGDYFYPFGMGMKKKKLKKFFTDLKIPLHEKEKIFVVESENKILWVCGQRIDERFKVSPETKQVLKIELKP
jgi:tRNA(Ile)-lysidine synthase